MSDGEGIDLFVPATYDVAWSGIVVAAILLVLAAVVLTVVLVLRRVRRGSRRARTVEARLAEVERLHTDGSLSDQERATARDRILSAL